MAQLKYLDKVDFGKVVVEWAKREKMSTKELLQNRNCLLKELPPDTSWLKVIIGKNDLRSLRVINNDVSWQILSDYSNELQRIIPNLENPPEIPSELASQHSYDGRTIPEYTSRLIEDLKKFREKAGDKGNNLTLILIALTKEGPFTILDGNHTAVGLYARHFIDQPEVTYAPHAAYVGISASMRQCKWYFDVHEP